MCEKDSYVFLLILNSTFNFNVKNNYSNSIMKYKRLDFQNNATSILKLEVGNFISFLHIQLDIEILIFASKLQIRTSDLHFDSKILSDDLKPQIRSSKLRIPKLKNGIMIICINHFLRLLIATKSHSVSPV